MTAVAVLALWALAYLAAFIWLLVKEIHPFVGGLALLVMSLVPMAYGRWTTASEWHDSPLMGFYYLPTLLAASVSLIVMIVGLFLIIRQTFRTWLGAD